MLVQGYVSQISKMLTPFDIKIPLQQLILSEEHQKDKKQKQRTSPPTATKKEHQAPKNSQNWYSIGHNESEELETTVQE